MKGAAVCNEFVIETNVFVTRPSRVTVSYGWTTGDCDFSLWIREMDGFCGDGGWRWLGMMVG